MNRVKYSGKIVSKSFHFKKETSLSPHFRASFNLFLIKTVLDWSNSQLSSSSLAITNVRGDTHMTSTLRRGGGGAVR